GGPRFITHHQPLAILGPRHLLDGAMRMGEPPLGAAAVGGARPHIAPARTVPDERHLAAIGRPGWAPVMAAERESRERAVIELLDPDVEPRSRCGRADGHLASVRREGERIERAAPR